MVTFRDPRGPKSMSDILIGVVILLVVCSIIGCIICCFQFRRDKRKKKAAKDMIMENARIGQKLTQQQAEALFELNESWERFSKTTGSITKKAPKLSRNAHAVLCVDYFRLQMWAKRLRDAEESAEEKDLHKVIKKVTNEMQCHSEMFQLKPETKTELKEIAQLPDKSVTFISPNRPSVCLV